MFNDVRLALRQLAAAKGFTISAMATLALGIGANTGIFTLVQALMMKSLPVADPYTAPMPPSPSGFIVADYRIVTLRTIRCVG